MARMANLICNFKKVTQKPGLFPDPLVLSSLLFSSRSSWTRSHQTTRSLRGGLSTYPAATTEAAAAGPADSDAVCSWHPCHFLSGHFSVSDPFGCRQHPQRPLSAIWSALALGLLPLHLYSLFPAASSLPLSVPVWTSGTLEAHSQASPEPWTSLSAPEHLLAQQPPCHLPLLEMHPRSHCRLQHLLLTSESVTSRVVSAIELSEKIHHFTVYSSTAELSLYLHHLA